MKAYVVEFHGVWLGGSAVVVATNRKHAQRELQRKFEEHGIHVKNIPDIKFFIPVELDKAGVKYLNDGDY